MNSSQGLRGFITFLILLAILITAIVGFKYISTPTNTSSEANQPKVEPLNVNVGKISDSSAEITWTTVDPSSSKLIYSKNLNAECLSSVETSAEDCLYSELSEAETSHTVKLSNLEPETTHFFRILTNGKIYPTDKNHTFRTEKKTQTVDEINEPVSEPSVPEGDYDGFGEVGTAEPNVVELNPNKVLGIQDSNVAEPFDPLKDIDKVMRADFEEALRYNDLNYDYNNDKEVTLADWPLFIESAMNYEE